MWSIRLRTLKMIMEASKDSYPREFGAFLKAEHEIIYEILMLPGTVQGDHHTLFNLYHKGIDFSVVGSVHSHPSGVALPSDADVSMFSNTGQIHIIVASPYRISDFQAFNRKSEKIDLKVL